MRASRANAVFWLAWLCAAAWCYFNTYDDPSSIFYRPDRAFRQRFSMVRALEADGFLNQTTAAPPTTRPRAPLLCIGIPSVKRTTQSFLGHTLGSLVDTLTPHERELIYIVVLLADRPPQANPAYGQPWLERLADQVVVYAEHANSSTAAPATNYHTTAFDVRGEGRGEGRVENMRLDHSVLVERCRGQKTPYFALVEDDVVASRDWFPRLQSAVRQVDGETRKSGRDWIYTRLFYSELLMGWNAEEWLTYAEVVFVVYAALLAVFLGLRRRHKVGPAKGAASSSTIINFNYTAALAFCLWMPAAITLFFMAGRISMRRLNPFGRSGVDEMPDYGCCAQGLVFPERHLEGLEALLRDPLFAFAGDQIIEDYARNHGLTKWALEPSVLQHVGQRESSEGPRKTNVWNFNFERLQRRWLGPGAHDGAAPTG